MPSDYIRSVPKVVGARIFDTAYTTPNVFYSENSNAGIFSDHTTVFEIWMCMDTLGSLTIVRTDYATSTSVTESPGVAQAVAANAEVDFEIRVNANEFINFTFSSNCTIKSFVVVELDSELA